MSRTCTLNNCYLSLSENLGFTLNRTVGPMGSQIRWTHKPDQKAMGRMMRTGHQDYKTTSQDRLHGHGDPCSHTGPCTKKGPALVLLLSLRHAGILNNSISESVFCDWSPVTKHWRIGACVWAEEPGAMCVWPFLVAVCKAHPRCPRSTESWGPIMRRMFSVSWQHVGRKCTH